MASANGQRCNKLPATRTQRGNFEQSLFAVCRTGHENEQAELFRMLIGKLSASSVSNETLLVHLITRAFESF
jgi:hypothetical protein